VPTPPPLPPPGPAPPTTVVTIPPDVLDKLAPHHSWFETLVGPIATIVAALIALGAAFFAWRSIRSQIAVDDKRAKRVERLTLISEMLTASGEFQTAAIDLHGFGGTDSKRVAANAAKRAFGDTGFKAMLARSKLQAAAGFDGVLNVVQMYLESVFGLAKTPPTSTLDRVNLLHGMMVSNFNKLLAYPEHWES
jgi:hypothetical protein